ncbi:aminoglycoside phosphotransferase (APT) family kinase protein [Phytomonospora endophytica]|uniref:Aminoglycoside phosphotransferase (APT) family kinase protein n=1 Tax=Phytomonospora endophytica TaxID=714109 RepID=A0A841FE89_9ACTN|nr:phosphotransferase family protein [Phytomonospora endophytica]MBB6035591.1 aminoglycoside phosphotransferase (APT) family kinase protein [Phytomonospora endophytica]GIG70047.1 acyl-CoA dehydrogenase [Phytomonospora endophytica]
MNAKNEAAETAGPPGLDVAGFGRWLAREHPGLTGDGPLRAALITGGRSNLTYRIDGTRVPLVLRRPPLGHVLSTAHDMAREHRVTSVLHGIIPVPPTVDVADDTGTDEVTGTVFFVMEHVTGSVMSRPSMNALWTREGLHRIGIELAEVLADLHAVDPEAVGLGDFGRPGGYLHRQMRTWRRQYDASRSRAQPALDELQDRLAASIPEEGARSGIVHGDYRLDNVLVDGTPGEPRVAAVLDWEMATLGDPLVDLGMLGMYWHIRDLAGGEIAAGAVDLAAGYPAFDEVADAYAARAGITVPDLSWYRAFACYKLAVILEGIHYRYTGGQTVGEGFDEIGAVVAPLAEEGLWISSRTH